MSVRPPPLTLRRTRVSFWTTIRYDATTGCWNWTGCRSSNGYGQMRYMGRMVSVHRLSAHFYLKLSLESELEVLHRCDNPGCFNPKHLFIGTQSDNIRDAFQKSRKTSPQIVKTHCPKGHPYSGSNLRIRIKNGSTGRVCKRCNLLATWKRRGKVIPDA